jgi:hypothetical protein
VDESPRRELGRFVLTGSANLLLMRRVSESLAGRAGYLTLWPMTRREMAGRGTAGDWQLLLDLPPGEWRAALRSAGSDPADWEALARVGGYPVPALELDGDDERSQWFEGYVRTYLERDLQDLSAIDSLADFRRLMRAAALRVGTLESQSEIARDIGVPRPTVHRWLNLLVTSYQLVRVEPYSVNRTKRLVKSPKLHWSDTGLALALGGSSRTGAHLENLVLTDLLAWREAHVKRPEILYWRTHAGAEVDFVIEHDGVLLPIEVKATRRPRPADIRHLRLFREEYGTRVPGALLLYCGDEVAWLAEDVLAAPWWRVL